MKKRLQGFFSSKKAEDESGGLSWLLIIGVLAAILAVGWIIFIIMTKLK